MTAPSVTTIPLAEQIKASRAIYERELARIEELSDAELLNLFASDRTLVRVLAIASDSTLVRVLAIASDSTVVRVLAIASDSTLVRVLAIASDRTVDRVLASDSTLVRVLAIASDRTVDRVAKLRNLEVPVVAELDRLMYERATAGQLNMATWHCGTTHCRAGWAVTLAGEAGSKLESVVGSEAAGRYIYEASTGRPAPDFFATNEVAMADIKRCAELAQGSAA